MDNANFLHLLENCEKYATHHRDLCNKLRDAFFHLSIARKDGVNTNPEDWRVELDPLVYVKSVEGREEECNIDLVSSPLSSTISKPGCGCKSESESKEGHIDPIDPILVISGIPPRSLRSAKTLFEAALKDIIELAKCSRVLQQ